jgi:DNA-binding IclR family transcriptional regulator
VIDSPLGEMAARTIQSRAALRRQLSEARRSGYSFDREETECGISCIGVLILDREDYPVAALSLSATDKQLMAMIGPASDALAAAVSMIRIGLGQAPVNP